MVGSKLREIATSILLFSLPLHGQPIPDGALRNHWDQIDDVVREEIAQGSIPGAVVLVGHADKVLYHKAFGHAVVEPYRKKMTKHTVFDLASLTKPVATAPSVLILKSQGKLSLEDRVSTYLPAFACLGKGETRIRQLLTHTSGLPAYMNAAEFETAWGSVCPEKLLEKICGLQALSQPGETFRYSCLGYITAARIVEIVSGKSVAEFSQEFVFQRLAMEHTGFKPINALREEIAATELADHQLHLGRVHDPLAQRMGGISGNAGLFSTAGDLSLYCRMLLNDGAWKGKRILNSEDVTLLTVQQSHGRACGFDVGSSYAWVKGAFGGESAFCHTGYTGTSLVCDPIGKRFLIILTNRAHPHDGGTCKPLRKRIAEIVFQPQESAGRMTETSFGIGPVGQGHEWQGEGKQGLVAIELAFF